MFIFHHEREFQNHNHIINLHQRKSGCVPMHIFHYIVMTYVYSGTLIMRVEYETITLHQGDIIILDKHVPHSVACLLYTSINPCYLTTLLKKYIHQSYKELIIQLRMDYAAKLILSNQDSIDNIARKSGYQNLTFF